ncbi:MAG TPA: hypothetical protein VNG35_10590 [Gemmatimonadales bacterium]|nr:hypothetical protein [Gemmatimonadales bacterium]
MKPRSIYVGGVIGRYFEPDNVGSILRLLRRPEVADWKPRFNDADVHRGRSQCASEFLLTSNAEVLIQIDSDIVFNPEDAVRICEAAIEHDVVGGVYVTRGSGKYCYPTSLPYNDRRVEFGNDPTPVKYRYVAGGFHAVHRRVFEKLALDEERMPLLNEDEPNGRFYPFYLGTWTIGESGKKTYLSEDWALSYRAREAGFGVFIDPSVRLLHLGMNPFRLEDMLTEPLPTQWLALTRHQGGLYKREALQDPALAGVPA